MIVGKHPFAEESVYVDQKSAVGQFDAKYTMDYCWKWRRVAMGVERMHCLF
jgi:hypothetical protein